MPEQIHDFKNIISEVIKKQIAILGPMIAIAKARKIAGLKINDGGEVVEIQGDPRDILERLINEYVDLSGLIIKRAMEPLLHKH
ncbi:MAG: hypothetical protein AAB464_02125 [Patescibacteria group bacterium]